MNHHPNLVERYLVIIAFLALVTLLWWNFFNVWHGLIKFLLYFAILAFALSTIGISMLRDYLNVNLILCLAIGTLIYTPTFYFNYCFLKLKIIIRFEQFCNCLIKKRLFKRRFFIRIILLVININNYFDY